MPGTLQCGRYKKNQNCQHLFFEYGDIKKKTMTLTSEEFLRRNEQHLLPHQKNNIAVHSTTAGMGWCALQQNKALEMGKLSWPKGCCHLAAPGIQATNALQPRPGRYLASVNKQ